MKTFHVIVDVLPESKLVDLNKSADCLKQTKYISSH